LVSPYEYYNFICQKTTISAAALLILNKTKYAAFTIPVFEFLEHQTSAKKHQECFSSSDISQNVKTKLELFFLFKKIGKHSKTERWPS
jgi:hypothetical protein